MTIENIKSALYSELGNTGKSITIFCEGNSLTIKVGMSETHILNWQTMPVNQIVSNVKNAVISESKSGLVLLNE